MRKICVINQKGGVGKTTTAVNLASGLSRKGKKVLLIDVDPQGDIAHSLTSTREMSVYHFLTNQCSYVDVLTNLGENLDLIHSTENLTKLNSQLARDELVIKTLRNKLEELNGYDYVIFDCAPSLSLLNQQIILFSDEALIPVATSYLAITGLTRMIEAIDEINNHFAHNLKINYIVPTLFDKRVKTQKEILNVLNSEYPNQVTKPIRINSKLSEAPKVGKSIFSYAKNSRGATDYSELVDKIILNEPLVKTINQPISARVQKLMADVELDD